MNTYKHSRGSLFLLELIINILMFSFLAVVSLRFFIKAHDLTIRTEELHNSVTVCTSAATLFESGDGSLDVFLEEFDKVKESRNHITIFYDDTYNVTSKKNSKYRLVIALNELADNPSIKQADITMKDGERTIYQVSAYYYCHLTPSPREVE